MDITDIAGVLTYIVSLLETFLGEFINPYAEQRVIEIGGVNQNPFTSYLIDGVREVYQQAKDIFLNTFQVPAFNWKFRLPDFSSGTDQTVNVENMAAIKEPVRALSSLSVPEIIVLLIFAYLFITMLIHLSRRFLPVYPVTQWGFRAKLIYADDSGKKRVFRNRSYKVSVNPDLLYRLANSKLAYIEYKSRNYLMQSDITQLEVGILALRGQYNVRRGAIALPSGELHWIPSASYSTARLFKMNKEYIEKAKAIKTGKWFPPERKNNCKNCPMRAKCWGK